MIRKTLSGILGAVFCVWLLAGCASSKPTVDQTARLQEAKAGAEAATKQLHDLRMKKAKLDAEKSEAAESEQPKK